MASNDAQESTRPKQRITTIVLAVLAIVFLVLRLVARRMKRIHLGADDWTLIVGLVCSSCSSFSIQRVLSKIVLALCVSYCGNQPRLYVSIEHPFLTG
jgi:hypothetical protein